MPVMSLIHYMMITTYIEIQTQSYLKLIQSLATSSICSCCIKEKTVFSFTLSSKFAIPSITMEMITYFPLADS